MRYCDEDISDECGSNVGPLTGPPFSRHRRSESLIKDSMAFVLMLSRAAGVAPVWLTREGQLWRVGYSHGMQVYGCLLVPALVLVSYIGLAVDISVGEGRGVRVQSKMSMLVWTCDLSCISAVCLAGVATGPARVRRMIAVYRDVDTINSALNSDLNERNENKRKVLSVVGLLTIFLLFVFDFKHVAGEAFHEGREWRICFFYLTFYFIYFIMFLLELQFVLLVAQVNSSLRAVNDALAQELHAMDYMQSQELIDHPPKSINKLIDSLAITETSRYAVKLPTSNISSHIRRLAQHHCSANNATRTVNRDHGPVIFIIIINLVLHLIETPYYVISDMFRKFQINGVELTFLFIQITWCFIHTMNMYLVIEPCHTTVVEMLETRELVSQLLRHAESPSDPLHQQLALFAEQLMLSRAEYAPLGVTTLHRPLIATILGGVTTYLVIIIQFQQLTG